MNRTKDQYPNPGAARDAGLLYLLVAITGAFGLIYIPAAFTVPGDVTATAGRIRAAELLFRLGIVSELIAATAFIFLVLALYRLLKGVNEKHAALMVTLVLVSVPISFFNVLNEIAVLILLSGADFLSVFAPHQLDALVAVFLSLHRHGFLVAEIFWGLWLFPFGVLVFKSGFLPRILGVLLIIACFAYLAASVTALLWPRYARIVSLLASAPEAAGELPIILWLLIKGAKMPPLDTPPA